jgi:hypothetical protein
MRESRLPNDLERVERLLMQGPRLDPSVVLRQRVLGQVHVELRKTVPVVAAAKAVRPRMPRNGLRLQLWREQQRSEWRLAVAIAGTLLITVSLSLGVFQATSFALQQHEFTPTLSDIAWQLQQLSPQVSKRDSEYQAKLRQIGDEGNSGLAVSRLLCELQSP